MSKESFPLLPPAEECIEAETDTALEPQADAGEPTPEPTGEPGFVCDCEEWMRSACEGLPFYREHESRRYCVLHYPGKEKGVDFKAALDSKLNKKDVDFRGAWFPDQVDFCGFGFSAVADFNCATFSAPADFSGATFSAAADFVSATFSADANFLSATFNADADFGKAKFSADASFFCARFSAAANFLSATFSEFADFRDARFSAAANFLSATFSKFADFSGATFSADADFICATFRADADFSKAKFSGRAHFSSATFEAVAVFGSATFGAFANFSSATFCLDAIFNSVIIGPNANADFKFADFRAMASFTSARFSGVTYYSSATFGGDAHFNAATFETYLHFSLATFGSKSDFGSATFQEDASFSYSEFRAGADFRKATFAKGGSFSGALFNDHLSLSGTVNERLLKDGMRLSKRALGMNTSLDFQHARFEGPHMVSFHTLVLRPHWFVNVDCSRLVFTDVRWNWDGIRIRQEIEALEKKGIAEPLRLLVITCRQLAENAELNNRYEEASRFRYWAMELARRTKWRRWTFWKTDWLHMLYWAVSGYGERILRALGVLAAVWIVFVLLYTQVGFAKPESKSEAPTTIHVIAAEPDTIGQPLSLKRAWIYSLGVMSLQKPEPKPLTGTAQTLVLLETILGPVQAALLALAIRRKFMR